MIKTVYASELTYDISTDEKKLAESALLSYNHAKKRLNVAKLRLDVMKTPFKENPEMDPKEVVKLRAPIRRFRDKCIKNFNAFKKISVKCINKMQPFSSDTQTIKLVKSFISSADELEDEVNKFAELFSNLEDKDFSKNVVEAIEEVQKKCDATNEIIDERIKTHIQSNILAKSWVDAISNTFQMEVEKRRPKILELNNVRQDALNDIIQEKKV